MNSKTVEQLHCYTARLLQCPSDQWQNNDVAWQKFTESWRPQDVKPWISSTEQRNDDADASSPTFCISLEEKSEHDCHDSRINQESILRRNHKSKSFSILHLATRLQRVWSTGDLPTSIIVGWYHNRHISPNVKCGTVEMISSAIVEKCTVHHLFIWPVSGYVILERMMRKLAPQVTK